MRSKVVLASASPRRRELLKKVIKEYESISPVSDEKSLSDVPSEIVKELAEHKAKEIAEDCEGALIIGADTIVVIDGKILGKPHSREQAVEMLSKLSGNTHYVYTGVCVLKGEKSCSFAELSKVEFYELSQDRIEKYIATGSPFDKAGGYGIQDSGFVKMITGSFDNVMGLPTEALRKCLYDMLTEKERVVYGVL